MRNHRTIVGNVAKGAVTCIAAVAGLCFRIRIMVPLVASRICACPPLPHATMRLPSGEKLDDSTSCLPVQKERSASPVSPFHILDVLSSEDVKMLPEK